MCLFNAAGVYFLVELLEVPLFASASIDPTKRRQQVQFTLMLNFVTLARDVARVHGLPGSEYELVQLARLTTNQISFSSEFF